MDLRSALQELAARIKAEIISRMSSEIGVNKKTGSNTLIGSDLMGSVSVEVKGEQEIVFSIADHYEYVVSGWRRTGQSDHSYAEFIENITQWIRRKGIDLRGRTENQVAHAIVSAIFRDGIKARPFIQSGYKNGEDPEKVLSPFLHAYWDEWSDRVFEEITKELDKYFNG